MELTATTFNNTQSIPSKYTCDGQNSSPELTIHNVPVDAKSLVLIMDDPDIPAEIKEQRGIEVFDHWILFNIPPLITQIVDGAVKGALTGRNSAGNVCYHGPCPPKQYLPNEHRYFFKLYALDKMLELKEGATKHEVEKAMQGHIVAQAELVGKYKRI
ncbi:YbhB/YbcL family Raf kinase inhibitor-like protein [Candidatus Woesearchaeota archaeon]|nr:YbhB/YbcL family Raf kinase inhibitor-like protein [Candidatus Woesearchaeota archaeon]